jgi:hypothetical protein
MDPTVDGPLAAGIGLINVIRLAIIGGSLLVQRRR